MKILIVDDQPHNVLLLKTLLEDKHEIVSTNDGFDAIELVSKNQIDLVLLDVLMPQIDGFEVLKRIKTNQQTNHIKVIMVTCKSDIEDIRIALNRGASDYIKKPVDSTELFTKIEIQNKLLTNKKQIQEYQVYANIHETMILAKHLQYSLLPDKETFTKTFPDSFVIYLPRDIVSGDFYFISKQNGKTFFALIDSASHGVPAAMLSIMAYMILHDIVNRQCVTNPEIVAFYLHQELKNHLYKSKDIYNQTGSLDAIFCEYDINNSHIKFVSAKRPMALMRKNDNQLLIDENIVEPTEHDSDFSLYILNGNKHEISIDNNLKVFESQVVEVLPNDRVFLFSDGYVDQIGGYKNKRFSRRQFYTNLLTMQEKNMNNQKMELYNLYADWSLNFEQTDDILLMGIKL